jgi:hypothetical protein
MSRLNRNIAYSSVSGHGVNVTSSPQDSQIHCARSEISHCGVAPYVSDLLSTPTSPDLKVWPFHRTITKLLSRLMCRWVYISMAIVFKPKDLTGIALGDALQLPNVVIKTPCEVHRNTLCGSGL